MTACEVGFYNNCTRQYDIDVKNCSSLLVYRLKPSDVCNSAYCFGNVLHKNHDLNGFFFSSPELIAQASFSDPFCPAFVCLTISPLSVHSTVSLSAVCPTVNVLHVRLLLQNHRSNFNQTKAKAYCMKGI